jgi:hypothetical protein
MAVIIADEASDPEADHEVETVVGLLSVPASPAAPSSARPAAHTIAREPEAPSGAPPRRFAKGTSPVSPAVAGATPVRPRAQADEPTATNISILDRTAVEFGAEEHTRVEEQTQVEAHTTPSLPISERPRKGALPSIRERFAR